MPAATPYDKDVIRWSQEQARLLRARRFSELDIEHLADEIEDVGKSEKREFASRMAVLLAHLLKWSRQPENRGNSWRATISHQRKRITLAIKETPSLKAVMGDPNWQEGVWLDALAEARKETGLADEDLPEACPWMAKKPIDVEALTHDRARRKNIPTAEFESVMRREEKEALRVAYERRNRDLDPQLVWRGKDVEDASDLVASAPPLYIQEKVQPKVIIDDLIRQSSLRRRAERGASDPPAPDLFADFNGLDLEAKTEFYRHDQHWSNRMIVGDSLSVMAGLAEREGLRSQVQCIYIDPPKRGAALRTSGRDRSHALRSDEVAAIEALKASDFPLSLTTGHWSQVTVHGVDVFKPQTGEVVSEGTDGIALWMLDDDYNEESFFVRYAYFLGANEPYKALKTTLKAEIDEEAWSSLYSDTSRPFDKPKSGRIAVKVINHLGDEVMKVFAVT